MVRNTVPGRQRPALSLPRPGNPADAPTLRRGPIVRSVAGRTLPRLLEANLIPAGILLVVVACADMGVAMVAVLAWTYAAVGWRLARRAAVPGLLLLATVGVSVRTLIALWSGSTLVYFLQPVGTTLAMGLVFLASVAIGRPVVARLASDFCPFTQEVALLPSVVRLFRGLTVLWSGVQLLKAGGTLTLLLTLPVGPYIAARTALTLGLTAAGIACTIGWALRTARGEGLAFAPADVAAGRLALGGAVGPG